MKDLFQRHKSGDTARIAKSAAPRLTLGAFGKHPGWDDHILGIGVETETLAQVKQALYVGGIGGQIDSGAWEKLEPEKRLAGYDHTFLWLRPGHVILGRLWSSTDGKGRTKYPMVLCIDGEAVAPGFMLTHLLPGLERLREACKATTSADQVTKDCRAAQEQLRAILSSADSRLAQTPLSAEARRHFLERPELGPDRLGFLRALHELGTGPNVRSRHLRLPLAGDSRTESLSLWSAFFRCAVSDTTPLLLISRADVNWTDVLIGESASDDFFCLQASNKAIPLATEIPYELPPESRARYRDLEAKFLSLPAPVAAVAPAADKKAEAPAAPGEPDRREPAKARSKWTSSLFIVGGVILLVAAGAIWLSGGRRDSVKPQTRVASATNQAISQPPLAKLELVYRNALTEAQRAWSATNVEQAIAQAQLALKAKPGDAVASNLLQRAEQRRTELAKAEEYRSAMDSARVAFERKDFSNAMERAGAALVIKSNDLAATKLKSDAQEQINLDLAAKAAQQKYEMAMREGQAAFDRKDYTNAVLRAEVALAIKKGDAAATKLKSGTQEQIKLVLAAQVQQQKYATAMREGQAAFDWKDYANAAARADEALGIRKGNAAATKLKAEANQGIDLASTQPFFDQGEYSKALELCKKHVGIPAFDTLARSIGIEQSALDDATNKFAKGDYSFIEQLKHQSYGGKKLFADLLDKAVAENGVLEELKALRRTTNWSEVKARLEDVAFQKKPPFKDLAAWAETQRQIAPKQSLEKLDSEFEVMLVWFDLLEPAKAQSSKAQQEARISGQISLDARDRCKLEAEDLESQFKRGGWLTPAREKNLKTLKQKIRDHP